MPTPTLKSFSTMTLRGLRSRYFNIWSREWPFPDADLAELWIEARATHSALTHRVPPPIVYEDCLNLMRECHEFTPLQEPTQCQN